LGKDNFDKQAPATSTWEQGEITRLFGNEHLAAFGLGLAAQLITRRNHHLGSLIVSDRGIFYIQILYRMLLFKRDHELEPLYEDIYQAIRPAQETVDGEQEYTSQQFRADMAQLADWDLIRFRIEKERLRGYRDNRRRKFRYSLTDEAAALLQWLENRLLDDLEERGSDARDLLQDVCGTLNELLRLLHHLKKDDEEQQDAARRLLFQLFKTDDLTQTITASLVEFNGRLLYFLVRRYDQVESKQIIGELDNYVQSFLNQVFRLRQEIVPLIDRLQQPQNQEKLALCFRIMETERLRTPHLLQARRTTTRQGIPERLHRFYLETGTLDQLHRRIGESVLNVWQKLRSHLRELERKNNRLEDLRARIAEMSRLPAETAPNLFLQQLLAPAFMYGDNNYWDENLKAEPPEPRRRPARERSFPRAYLRHKQTGDRPVQTPDEARLAELDAWLAARVFRDDDGRALVSKGRYQDDDDFHKVVELTRAGYLNNGRRLARLACALTPAGAEVALVLANKRLTFREMLVEKKNAKGKKEE